MILLLVGGGGAREDLGVDADADAEARAGEARRTPEIKMDTTLTEAEKKAIRVGLATAILRGANTNNDEDKPPRRDAIDAELVAAREAAVLDAPAGSGDAVCQELALLARTRFAKSPQLLAAFLAASGVLAREAPASFPRVAALARSVAGATVDAAPGAVTRALAFLRALSAARAAAHESNFAALSPRG